MAAPTSRRVLLIQDSRFEGSLSKDDVDPDDRD
jgi:hypothetical protein